MSSIEPRFEKPYGMIVKVQMPLATNEEEPLALVYNKDRSYRVFMRITPELEKAMGDRAKVYFKAHYDRENHNTVLGEEMELQRW